MRSKFALAAVAVLALFWATAASTPAYALNSSYYVDCSATSNGTGTQSSPWNSLASVNSKSGGFSAGDSILFKRSTTCSGSLRPLGSGASGNPATISTYGTGARPAIVAPASSTYALMLSDQSYWTVDNLDISGSSRYGVFVTVTTGVVNGISLTNLHVHDVRGGQLDSKNTGLVVVSPTHDSSNSSSARFNNVLIDGVEANGTNMWSGIIVGSGTNSDAWATTTSKRSTNVTVRNSTVYDIYGDGIILFAVNTGLIEKSVAHDTGKQPTQTIGTPNGIWTWACNGCTVQYNEAYNNDSPGVDGGAFDVDYFSDNTVVQYNYGHDNSAYCIAVFGAENYTTSNTIVRYNVCANNGTQNVGQRTELEISTWNGGLIDGLQVYNNTFITNHGAMHGYSSSFTGSQPRTFTNNLVYSTSSNPFGSANALASDYNLWYYTGGNWTNSEPHSTYADPQINDPGHTGSGSLGTAYTLTSTSPAVDAGTTISGSGTRDYYGNAVPRGNATDIGAHESAFSRTITPPSGETELLTNPGFEAGSLAGWGGGSLSTSNTRSGTYSASIVGSSNSIYRTVTGLSPSTTYTYSAWVKADAGNEGFLYAKSFGGTEVQSGAITSGVYTLATLTFTTGAASSSVEIGLWRNAGSGTGSLYIDDTSLKAATGAPPATNLLTNGGFESGTLSDWSNWPSGAAVSTAARTGTYSASLTGSGSGIYRTVTGLLPNTTYTLTGWLKSDAGQQGYLYVKSFGAAELRSTVATAQSYGQYSVTFTTGASNTSAELGLWRDTGSGTGSVFVDDVTLN